MTVAGLIEELKKLPQDMKVWVSEGGLVDGAMPLVKICVEQAWSAGLDGDEIEDEYEYVDCMDNPQEDLSAKGYELVDGGQVWTKNVVIIKTDLDA